jgi:hypothetical protein
VGHAFPDLLTSGSDGREIVASIPAADLFDRNLRKHIVLAHGRFRATSTESSYTTSIHWTVSLTDVRTKKAARASATASPQAAQDRARPVVYHGKTHAGDPISFKVTGSRVSGLSAFVPTVCLATDGLPLSGTDPFDPPGSFRIGRTGKATAKRDNAIWNTSKVTKHFRVTLKRQRSGVLSGKLHVDYSFLQILFTYPISSRPYVCSGDTTFRLRPPK